MYKHITYNLIYIYVNVKYLIVHLRRVKKWQELKEDWGVLSQSTFI